MRFYFLGLRETARIEWYSFRYWLSGPSRWLCSHIQRMQGRGRDREKRQRYERAERTARDCA